MQCCKR